MKKIYFLLITVLAFTTVGVAQPTVLGTQLVNGSYTTYDLNSIGLFKQYRLQATSSAPISTRNWEFASGTAGATNYAINWRPYTSGNTLSSNLFIPTSFANGAKYNTGFGGQSGLLPVISSGNYYTFNVNINATSDNQMELLETTYSPVTITSVSNTTPANASNSVLVSCTTSAAPSSGEYVYVRYSIDGYATSALSQFTFSGTTGKALIPCQLGGTVVSYYVMSSNQLASQITSDVATYGQSANDMATLNLNNGGSNYTYTQGSGTNFGGIYSTPSTCYSNVNAFVSALNGGTVSAPVTCYVIGGSPTETAPAGGISITQSGTVANPIIFQKFGTGSYTIQASTALTVGNINDAIIKLIGADYITIDGLTLQENNANTINTPAASNNMTEWGIALLRSSATDGAQNNTIQNNTISLNRSYANSFGIYSSSIHTAIDPLTFLDITNNTTAPHSGNKIYSNAISNVNSGICFIGSRTAANHDVGNDLGGSSAATGNTITNWGGAAELSAYVSNPTNVSYCIFMDHQVGENVSYNTLTSATAGSGSLIFAGIRKDYTDVAPIGTFTSTISNNTITMTSTFTGSNFECIRSQGMTALSTATISITSNLLLNNAITAAGTTSAFGGIINSSAPGTLNITNNIMRGLTTVSSGGFTGISNGGAVVNTINITNNQIGNASGGAATYSVASASQINCITNSAAGAASTINITGNSVDGLSVVTFGQTTFILNTANGGTAVNLNNNMLGSATGSLINFSGAQASAILAIYTQSTPAAGTVTIQGNDIRGIVHGLTSSATEQFITNGTAVLSQNISNNTFTNLSLKSSGFIFFIVQSGALANGNSFTCNNNQIVTGFSKTNTGGQVEFLHCTSGASASGSTITETGNNFSNVTLTGSSPLFGWNESSGASGVNGPTKTITGNTFNNITMGSGLAAVMYLWKGTNINCSSNTISNISGPTTIWGIVNETTGTAGAYTISSNTISNLSSTGGDVEGIIGGTGVTSTVMANNIIFNLSSTAASAVVAGIDASATTATINDNLIHGLSGSGTTSPNANGILIKGGTSVNVYKNKIYDILESGAISTTSPAVNGLVISGGTTVNAYNNFISDLKATNANLADAIRGISVTSATASTNYNLYYNSIYLNATSTGTNFGSSGIYHSASATSTTAALNMIDNIITNISTATGTGVTAAYRRSGIALNNYAATADYNLFYAGTPSASKLIFYDGTNSDLTLASYQARVTTRDANSISVLPNFTSSTDLHLTAANNCSIEGAGTPVGSVTTDIDAQARDAATPDIGADEFTATYNITLAGVAGSATCSNKNVSASGTTYATSVCDLIAKVLPSGGSVVTGKINACVTLDATQQAFNGEPYVQRHFDIQPAASPTTATGTVTLYFTNAEFVAYNTNNLLWPKLPTSALGNADPARANLRVTEYLGSPTTSPSTPGNYTGPGGGIIINPGSANVFWNGNYWEVSFNVTGFGGFYVHSTVYNTPLSVSFNYLNGVKQGDQHLLSWSVTCNTTPRVTLTLERSPDGRNFNSLYSITADAVRCAQPFNYLDAQPLTGMNYYRLKIVDADGKISYSNIIALINGTKGFALMNIAPNPVRGNSFKLNAAAATASKTDIVISDMQGRIMSRQTILLSAGYNSVNINVSTLAPGTYNIYGISADEKSGLMRFVRE